MENNETVDVRILFVSKIKDGKKSMIKFALESNETKNARGYLIIDQYLDTPRAFENITVDYIDTILEGKVEYRHTFGANAVIQLVELYDENGNNLLA